MSSEETALSPMRQMYDTVLGRAHSVLEGRVEPERIDRAAREVAQEVMHAIQRSRDPDSIMRCSPASVAAVVQQHAVDGLRLGGSHPEAYLVPRHGQLTRPINHRGLLRLARRQGLSIRTVLVGEGDELEESMGTASHHRAVGARPRTLGELRCVLVVVRERGRDPEALVVDGDTIRQRATAKGAGPVWKTWPMEMAQKAAVKYVFARGWLPIEGDLDTAMTIEAEYQRVDARPGGASILTALPDHSITDGGDDE